MVEHPVLPSAQRIAEYRGTRQEEWFLPSLPVATVEARLRLGSQSLGYSCKLCVWDGKLGGGMVNLGLTDLST